jgi:hypothetical protein
MTNDGKLFDVYIAHPYSHIVGGTLPLKCGNAEKRLANRDERKLRWRQGCIFQAHCVKEGLHAYNAIGSNHGAAEYGGLKGDWQFWKERDIPPLLASRRLFVLMLDGWKESRGVMEEIEIARANEIPVTYWDASWKIYGQYGDIFGWSFTRVEG